MSFLSISTLQNEKNNKYDTLSITRILNITSSRNRKKTSNNGSKKSLFYKFESTNLTSTQLTSLGEDLNKSELNKSKEFSDDEMSSFSNTFLSEKKKEFENLEQME